MRRLLTWLVKKLPQITITVRGVPYLTRYYLFGADRAWGNIYVHHFQSSDQPQELHNHPWAWGVSLVLWGGYIEERLTNRMGVIRNHRVLPGAINTIKAHHFHRVDLLRDSAWTLFITGPRMKSWGFLDRKTREFKDWRSNPEAIE